MLVALLVMFAGGFVPNRTSAEPPTFPAELLRFQDPGPEAVEILRDSWHDARRTRDVPVKIYRPRQATERAPVILFSHGLGASREHYAYLGEHWASHGFISVHVEHDGSNTEIFRAPGDRLASLRRAVTDPSNALHRPYDVRFTLDELTRRATQDEQWRGRLDLEAVGAAGHSFGAHTTMLLAGQRLVGGLGNFADTRIRAAIAMSTPAPLSQRDANFAFNAVTIPILHLTGTRDYIHFGDSGAADRRIPFDQTRNAPAYLVTFQDGDHYIFSGRPRLMTVGQSDAQFQALIRLSSTLFWRAQLRADVQARAWLDGPELPGIIGNQGVVERRQPDPVQSVPTQ